MKNKSLYAAALDSELHHNDSLDKFCKLFNNIADAFDWMKKEHTDDEIAKILSQLGYNIEIKTPVNKIIKPKENNSLKKTSKTQRLLTPKEAASYLGASLSALSNWRHLGRHELPFVRWGRCVRYRKEDLDAWIQSHVVNSNNKETYVCKAGLK